GPGLPPRSAAPPPAARCPAYSPRFRSLQTIDEGGLCAGRNLGQHCHQHLRAVFVKINGQCVARLNPRQGLREGAELVALPCDVQDRKSTRLNSSHVSISYAVFCLKKKT